jgi:hypothetical protein
MAFKEYILEAMIKDLNVCQHLYEKIPIDAMDKRPGEKMRSTKELLQYIAFIGGASVESYVAGGWGNEKNIQKLKAVREEASKMDAADFVADLEEEKEKITALIAPLTDEDLLHNETTQPWGQRVKLIEALLNNSLKYLAAYRLQLFTYAKMWGADINTANAWRGVDSKAQQVAQTLK